jgi:dTDP-4-amino-4,6-dideoxygalactose transaminase
MISKIPIIGSTATRSDLLYAFRHVYDKTTLEKFHLALSQFIPSKYIYLTNSGISAFYLILKSLQENSPKKEVILPAYTAGSLVVGIMKAGLKPVLCDISLEDFNLDTGALLKVISPNTLAVVVVHMFGIALKDIERLRKNLPSDIFLIEDCAQSMGSKIKEKQTGKFSDISFFSFNRGKNLPVYGGGCIVTNNEKIVQGIEGNIKNLEEQALFTKFFLPFKVLVFCLATNPYVYGLSYIFASHFKETQPPKDFSVKKINNFQAGLGLVLMKRQAEFFLKRYEKGIFLLNALKEVKEIILPRIAEDSQPIFNRLPILFKDLKKREIVEKELWKKGIETSRMYLKPLHQMFDLGYKKESFPNANYLAEHLLTLPVHRLVKQQDLEKMIEVVRQI